MLIILLLLLTSSMMAQISIDTSFEGSNCRTLSIDNAGNTVKMESILKRGDVHNVVFYFKVSGIDSTRSFKLKVKYTQQYYLPALLAYSYDKITWYRISGTIVGDSKEFTNTYSRRTIYFSHGYPYVYSRLNDLITQYSGNPFVNVSNVSTSEIGRAVKLFKFTNPGVPDTGKVSVWILGRNHAMETHSNYVVEGLMDFLASADAKAEYLRTKAIVYVVPIMDVDMAALGGTGKDQIPVDFNRDWDSPSYWNAVRDVKTKILQTSAQNRIRIFIDSHDPFPSAADTASRLFMYSFTDTGRKSANLNIFRNKLFNNGGYWFGRQTIYPTSGQTSSRWVDSMFTSIDFSTSIETGWVTRTDGNTWTIYFYRKHGEVIGKGISDFIAQSTPVIETSEVISDYATAYPNPFNASTNIKLSLSKRNRVSILVFDVNGREVSREDLGALNTGSYNYKFNASLLSSGTYFYSINNETGTPIYKGKLVLLK
jgi:hypothetical protein